MWPYLALAVGAGVAMALGWPAARAMPPTLVSIDLLQNAMTLRSIASQAGMVIGPAFGGLLYGVSPSLVYLLAAGSCVVSSGFVLAIHPQPAADLDDQGDARPPNVESVLEGLRFVRRTPVLLGAILLDLLAVLFGGAVALLPVFARSILHVGADRPRSPARGAGDRRAAGRGLDHPAPDQAEGRTDAADRGRAVRREHHRVRPLARVRDLAARARQSAGSSTSTA